MVDPDKIAGSACFGISAVLRMTFALFCFHALMVLLILPRMTCSALFHDGGWLFKVIVVGIAFVGLFWIPINYFSYWAEASRYASCLFFVLQVLYVLSGAYTFNDFMTGEDDPGQACRLRFLLLFTIVLTCGSIALTGACFLWFLGYDAKHFEGVSVPFFEPDSPIAMLEMEAAMKESKEQNCNGNMIIIISTICMQVAVFAMRFRDDASIFTSAMVNMWLSFLAWSALASQPDTYCNTHLGSNAATFFQIATHVVWTFVTLFSFSIA